MNDKLKGTVVFWLLFLGALGWAFGGHRVITENPEFKHYIAGFGGQGWLSLKSLWLAVILISVFIYPPMLWFAFWMEVLDRGSLRRILCSKAAPLFIFAPVFIIAMLAFLFILRAVIGLTASIVLSLLPLLVFWFMLKEIIRSWRKRKAK